MPDPKPEFPTPWRVVDEEPAGRCIVDAEDSYIVAACEDDDETELRILRRIVAAVNAAEAPIAAPAPINLAIWPDLERRGDD